MTAVIQLNNVSKIYGREKAVDHVSLEIKENESIALLGPNGAGKTSLIEMMIGILKPDNGEVFLWGKTWEKDAMFLKQRIGICLQETRFFDRITVEEVTYFFAVLHGLDQTDSQASLKKVGLWEKRHQKSTELSGGQKQKLSLALSLLHHPKLLFLDEPTTGLDPYARREFWTVIQDLKRQGMTLILTTHYMEEAEVLCDEVVLMNKGKIVAKGNLTSLQNQLGLENKDTTLDDLFINLTGRHLYDE